MDPHLDPHLDPASATPQEPSNQPPPTFRLAANGLGLLAMLGIGWLAATGILMADEAFELGMGAGTEGPVLSFMLALGAPLLLCSLLCWALLLRGEREWRCTPPWSWIQRASLVHLVGALLLGAIQMVLA